jgi:hypothetical protein
VRAATEGELIEFLRHTPEGVTTTRGTTDESSPMRIFNFRSSMFASGRENVVRSTRAWGSR